LGNPVKNLFTEQKFRERYPCNDACLEEMFRMTYGQMGRCSKCKSELGFVRVKSRKAYQCRKCYLQVYPLTGTAFENTKIPLLDWFKVIFHFTVSKNGVACHEVTRLIGVSPQTALRMLKKIREFIFNDEGKIVDASLDESFVGGKNVNRHYEKKVPKSQGRSYKDKVPVVGMMENSTGRVIAKVSPKISKQYLHPLIRKYVVEGSTLYTDEYRGYRGLEKHFQRVSCNHKRKQYVSEDGASTNMVENFWSVMKRTIKGSYIKVSKKYLHLYVKEIVFRFNNRHSQNLFDDLMCCMLPSST
jgi:transposase-like protein